MPLPAEPLPTGNEIVAAHDRWLRLPRWPGDTTDATQADTRQPSGELWSWLQANHRFNSLLWAEEDLARRTTVADADIAANKRAIDGYNQARNDATERLDEVLLLALGLVDPASAHSDAPLSLAAAGARLNSETAGAMVDRMSIMALKLHAMQAQSQRMDVDDSHRAASLGKWQRLLQQRLDLATCLDNLLADAAAGRAYFKVYRQFKMYNDPRLNPALVQEQQAVLARRAS